MISIHAPPRGATDIDLAPEEFFDFNSRPSARGDAIRIADALGVEISIHAPPRGATHFDFVMVELRLISIHAPPRGATEGTINYVAQL